MTTWIDKQIDAAHEKIDATLAHPIPVVKDFVISEAIGHVPVANEIANANEAMKKEVARVKTEALEKDNSKLKQENVSLKTENSAKASVL